MVQTSAGSVDGSSFTVNTEESSEISQQTSFSPSATESAPSESLRSYHKRRHSKHRKSLSKEKHHSAEHERKARKTERSKEAMVEKISKTGRKSRTSTHEYQAKHNSRREKGSLASTTHPTAQKSSLSSEHHRPSKVTRSRKKSADRHETPKDTIPAETDLTTTTVESTTSGETTSVTSLTDSEGSDADDTDDDDKPTIPQRTSADVVKSLTFMMKNGHSVPLFASDSEAFSRDEQKQKRSDGKMIGKNENQDIHQVG